MGGVRRGAKNKYGAETGEGLFFKKSTVSNLSSGNSYLNHGPGN